MLLAIDTATRFAAVAVVAGTEVVFAEAGVRPRSHVEELGPILDRAMRWRPAGQRPRGAYAGPESPGPAAVVLGRGPGSFAGLRVGLSAGQTMAWALGVPAVGVCSLDALALAVDRRFTGYVVSDARRRELFYAEYADGERCGDPAVSGREQVAGLVAGHDVVGDVDLLVTMDRKAAGTTAVDPIALGLVAARAVQRGRRDPALPLYLRAPDISASAASPAPRPAPGADHARR